MFNVSRRRIIRLTSGSLIAAFTALAFAACDSPTEPTTPQPVTETFSGTFQPRGAASKSFVAATAGDVKLTLTSASPSNAVFLLAFGTTDPDGRNCTVVKSIEAAVVAEGADPQMTQAVAAGPFCVHVSDPGNLINTNGTFGVTVVRP